MMNVTEAQNYRQFIKFEFESRKARNNAYSLRAFANSLNISSGALSEILNEKRNLGPSKAREICERLCLNENEKDWFLSSVKNQDKTKENKGHETHFINLDVFEVISNPLCTSIVALSDTQNFRLDVEWIATRLDHSEKEVAHALLLLRNVGILTVENGLEKITQDIVISPTDIPSNAIRNYHHHMLDKSKEALDHVMPEKRDFQSLLMAVDREDLAELKKEIQKFQKRLIKKFNQKENLNEVIHLHLNLIPMTNEDKNENHN
jgi:uncharacterized protein (TIGR02147 family)